MTEQQLAAYEARTASGAALKERLESAVEPSASEEDSEAAGQRRRTLLR